MGGGEHIYIYIYFYNQHDAMCVLLKQGMSMKQRTPQGCSSVSCNLEIKHISDLHMSQMQKQHIHTKLQNRASVLVTGSSEQKQLQNAANESTSSKSIHKIKQSHPILPAPKSLSWTPKETLCHQQPGKISGCACRSMVTNMLMNANAATHGPSVLQPPLHVWPSPWQHPMPDDTARNDHTA